MEEIRVKNATNGDLDDVVRLENEIWPEEIRAPKEKFERRLEVFQKGFFVVYKDNKIVGVSTSEMINYDPKNPPHSWEEITDNGWIEKTHNPKGNAIYVVSVGAISRSGGGTALVEAQKRLVKRLNLKYLVLGARVPYYHKKTDLKIEDYLKLKNENDEPFDPEIRFYSRCGLKIVKAIPNYMEDDPESKNYGVVMAWKNR